MKPRMEEQKNDFPPKSLPPGYFLGQEASSVSRFALFRRKNPYFQNFLTLDTAERYFEQIAGKVDGLDYVNYWYDPSDADMARKIAELGRSYGIDMWAGIRWQKQFRDIPAVPPEYAAWTMDEQGHICPAMWEQRTHVFDYLHPEAVDWFLDVLEERYWPHMEGAVNGFFFPECRVTCVVPYNRTGLKSWTLHAYSDYVLDQWRDFCSEKNVKHKGRLVDRFPVPFPRMAEPHPDKTIYIADNRPSYVPSFTRLNDIPEGTEVWLHWEEFLCQLFHRNFIHKIARRVNRYHAAYKDWKGICYFNNDVTMLDYRNFKTRDARTGIIRGYWPQGRRMGVDLKRLLKDSEITCFISETVQSVRDYIGYEENSLSHGMDLAREYNREQDYGFMLHYSADWGGSPTGGGLMDDKEEELRWEMFHKYRPPVFSFYSIPHVLVKEGEWYNREAVNRFWKSVEEYKRTFIKRK